MQLRAAFREHWGNVRFGFFAQMAAFPHIHGDVKRRCYRESPLLRSPVEVAASVPLDKSSLGESGDRIKYSFALRGDIATDIFEECVQVDGVALDLVKRRKYLSRDDVHCGPRQFKIQAFLISAPRIT